MFSHLFIYLDNHPLLEWPDAFSNQMFLSSQLGEERVARIAKSLGLAYELLSKD